MAQAVRLDIYPYPLTNLVVMDSNGNTYSNISYSSYTFVVSANRTYTISADGYVTQTITIEGNTEITLQPKKDFAYLSDGSETYYVKDAVARDKLDAGVSGSFTTNDGKTVTITGGIITDIS
ncbi:MAG: hypothetical protein IJS26_01520 [Alphaproteobacteria bacterium]|nr:hypothetical protein [Alphaproteobacteria bacterium]